MLNELPQNGAVPLSNADHQTILAVDDNAANRYVISRILRHAGFRVIEAASGREALTLAPEMPALILLDVNLPDMSGFEVCRILKSDPKLSPIPVVHLTASFATSENKVTGLEGGADAYLFRPVEAPELVATVHAILRAREAEQIARQMSEEWQATFDAISDGACLLDSEGAVIRCNKAMSDLLGEPPYVLRGQTLKSVLQDRFGVSNVLKGIGPRADGPDNVHIRQLGDRWYRVARDPVVLKSEQSAGSVCVFHDITDARKAQEEIAASHARIQDLNDRLRQGMRETHHRVKNNLQIIAAMVDLQLLEGGNEVSVSELNRLGMHIKTLAAVHDLLTAHAKEDESVEWVSARDILERLLPLLRDMAGEKTIHSEIDDAPLTVRQATSLALVANEVVNNALKHGRGEVGISFKSEGDRAYLCITDEGPGFPPDFDPQRHANTGLELVNNLSRWDLGGNVCYSNRAEGGSAVTIYIPISGSAGA